MLVPSPSVLGSVPMALMYFSFSDIDGPFVVGDDCVSGVALADRELEAGTLGSASSMSAGCHSRYLGGRYSISSSPSRTRSTSGAGEPSSLVAECCIGLSGQSLLL